MTDWRQVYRAAVSESNPPRLLELIRQLEDLTSERMQQLIASPDPEESRDIQSALADLLTIKENRLQWPDPRTTRSAMTKILLRRRSRSRLTGLAEK